MRIVSHGLQISDHVAVEIDGRRTHPRTILCECVVNHKKIVPCGTVVFKIIHIPIVRAIVGDDRLDKILSVATMEVAVIPMRQTRLVVAATEGKQNPTAFAALNPETELVRRVWPEFQIIPVLPHANRMAQTAALEIRIYSD